MDFLKIPSFFLFFFILHQIKRTTPICARIPTTMKPATRAAASSLFSTIGSHFLPFRRYSFFLYPSLLEFRVLSLEVRSVIRVLCGVCLVICEGCGNGFGSQRGGRQGMDDGIGNGRAFRPCRGGARHPSSGVDVPVVALHQVPSPPDACRLHLQRLRAAHDEGDQPTCLYRRHRLRPGK